ncbi:citrate lyase, acyl carrier (gamma) subunit [Tepidanaerobacter acetatoxydans Re1]|uniref:Citrate lyase acyl carrier protein n=1 Tax=Tepidanaerobacter acetatoxydans (strain DSM 21804 / JCM 16047 / Re1) TaxID=1209989 RepID=F4LSK4_TEPAE|nr:citrate lyase acyl carrier protein [Tepidanaerobacter acetatoxydans]AEE92394.1 Citrate lyase acyl carrier protein [Tepidanaerobacter acetatoxydans Re1]CCP27293.1 citrate lyase, acyl carrier (gamma) subunit [Tepidanaerobacter acetatoxydans Re1]
MQIKNTASAGTLESGDIMIILEEGDNGIEIDLNSTVEKQYGEHISEVIKHTLMDLGVRNAKVVAKDRGALDCTIKARVMAAYYRAIESTDYKWGDGE